MIDEREFEKFLEASKTPRGRREWDVYSCEGGHKIIIEAKEDWPSIVQLTFVCPICQELAHYSHTISVLDERRVKEGDA